MYCKWLQACVRWLRKVRGAAHNLTNAAQDRFALFSNLDGSAIVWGWLCRSRGVRYIRWAHSPLSERQKIVRKRSSEDWGRSFLSQYNSAGQLRLNTENCWFGLHILAPPGCDKYTMHVLGDPYTGWHESRLTENVCTLLSVNWVLSHSVDFCLRIQVKDRWQ
jgi:hypothetical protein